MAVLRHQRSPNGTVTLPRCQCCTCGGADVAEGKSPADVQCSARSTRLMQMEISLNHGKTPAEAPHRIMHVEPAMESAQTWPRGGSSKSPA